MKSQRSVNLLVILLFLPLIASSVTRVPVWPFIPFDMYCEGDGRSLEFLELRGVRADANEFKIPNHTFWPHALPTDLLISLLAARQQQPAKLPAMLLQLKTQYEQQTGQSISGLKAFRILYKIPEERNSSPEQLSRELIGEAK